MPPATHSARHGEVSIAYQVFGEGSFDIVLLLPWGSHVELAWDVPVIRALFERLGSFARVINFDKRGVGLSDKSGGFASPETRMDDIRAVMDAVGIERAALFGNSEGASMCLLFAATYPERTSALVVFGSFAKRVWDPEYPWAPRPEERQRFYDAIGEGWGGVVDLATIAPSRAGDPAFRSWFARYLQLAASPGAALALAQMNTLIDIRQVLPTIRVPTLVLHRTGDLDARVEEGRYIASRIPGAKFVELPGVDHLPWVGDPDSVLDEVEQFLTGARRPVEVDRVLATVLFTDIVDSTRRAGELGDRRWRETLELHHRLVRAALERYRGREVDTAGDGVLASFDGPARAVRCATEIRDRVRALGLEIRAGLHTGECEAGDGGLRGIAVHIGARVAALAGAGEIWVSSTVKDLVSGSGLAFADRGPHQLKGVTGEWRLFSLDGGG